MCVPMETLPCALCSSSIVGAFSTSENIACVMVFGLFRDIFVGLCTNSHKFVSLLAVFFDVPRVILAHC